MAGPAAPTPPACAEAAPLLGGRPRRLGSAPAAAGGEEGRAGPGGAGRAGRGGVGRGGAPQELAACGGLAITPGLAASSGARAACPGSSGPPPQPPRRPVMLPPPPPCALWEREEAALRRCCHRGGFGFSRAHAASQRLRVPSIICLPASVAAASSRAAEPRSPPQDTRCSHNLPVGASPPGCPRPQAITGRCRIAQPPRGEAIAVSLRVAR